jgi:hypothetical protein
MQVRITRILLVLCISLVFINATKAQHASRVYVEPDGWSIGTNFGITDLWGDVGTKSFLSHYTNSKYFDKMAFMGGMFGRYSVHPVFAIRFGLNFGTLYATDNWNYDLAEKSLTAGADPVQRYLRSQNAKTYVSEGAAIFELIPRRRNPESRAAHRRGQPFFGAGLGVFYFNPYSTVAKTPRWVPTYDLRLEGQGFGDTYPKNYSRWQICAPIVVGYRWDLGMHLNLGIEYMYRVTMTDYLDGVSGKYIHPMAYEAFLSPKDAVTAQQVADKQPYFNNSLPNAAGNMRGNPDNKDGYSSLSVTLYYKVLRRDRLWWRGE